MREPYRADLTKSVGLIALVVLPTSTAPRAVRQDTLPPVLRSILRLPVIAAGLALVLGLWEPARADCRPDGSDFDHGSTIVCTGTDGNGWPSEPPDPDDEDPPEFPINNLTIIVQPGATVSGSPDPRSPITLSLFGVANTVVNNGAISTSGGGAESVGIAGGGARVTNNGTITTSGFASESIGIAGGSARISNNGAITTSGDLSVGIGIEGPGAQATNNNNIRVSGDGAEGIGVEGPGATLENTGTILVSGVSAEGMGIEGDNATATNSGMITTDGTETTGIGVEGDGATMTNSGTVRTLQAMSTGLGLFGNGAPGDRAAASNSGLLDIQGANSLGIGAIGGNMALTNQATGTITLGGANATGLGAIGLNGFISSDSHVTNEGTITGSQADSTGIRTFGFDNTATNTGTITLNGDRATGIAVQQIAGGDGTTRVANSISANISPDGADAIGIKGSKVAGGAFEIDNANIVSINGARGQGIAFEGSDLRVTNATTGQIGVTGAQSRGIVGGEGSPADGAIVVNAGTIDVTDDAGGTGARGIEITGDDLTVNNGLGAASTRLNVSGNDGIGIAVTGKGAKIDNDAPITMSGSRVRGVDVVAQNGAARYRVTNWKTIAVGGEDGAGIVFRSAGPSPGGTLDPRERLFINLGTIDLDGARTVGIAFDGMSSSSADNARTIRTNGRHAGARGIALTGGNDNIVNNFDSIDLASANAVGIDVAGNGNTVLIGSGATTFPNALTDIDPTGNVLFPNGLGVSTHISMDDPTRPVVPVGEILVDGANAVGIRISGADNQVGIQIQDDVRRAKVVASGAGAAAVALSGPGNVLVNQGLLSGQAVGVLGGGGTDIVVNRNVIEGGIRLEGGGDELIVADGSSITGVADGGDGNDTLTMFVATPSPTLPASPPFAVHGSGFVNFETMTKIGGGAVDLTGALNVANAGVFQGTLGLTSGSQLIAASNVTVQRPTASSVPSRLEVRAGSRLTATAVNVGAGASLCNGGMITGALNIDIGGTYAAGCSVGTATLAGDLVSTGLLEVEIAGLGPGTFDVFDISGDAIFLGGDILFSFIDDFAPGLGDSFDFLRADRILGLENLDFAFAGLPDGFGFDLDAASPFELRLLTAAVPGDAQVPEPSTLILFGLGLTGLALIRRRRIE